MYPILFEIPVWSVKIHAYGVFMFLACVGALGVTLRQARRDGLDTNSVYELAAWLFLGGVIGARALFVIQNPETVQSVADVFRSWKGGNIFYGCIIGGLTGTLLYWYRRPFPFWRMADAVAPALAVGVAFGRTGCLLNGCCFGSTCAPWPGLRYPSGSLAWLTQVEQGELPPAAAWSLPTHPTQLYAILAGVSILLVLLGFAPYRRRHGEVMALLMIAYAATRWPIEMLRGDDPAVVAGMTLSQLISLVLLLGGLLAWWRLPAGRAGTRSIAKPHVDVIEHPGPQRRQSTESRDLVV